MDDFELENAARSAFESAMAFGIGLDSFMRLAKQVRKECGKVPDVLFDGCAVLEALDDKAKDRTGPENVSDVLDAVVRIMRSNALAQADAACGVSPGATG